MNPTAKSLPQSSDDETWYRTQYTSKKAALADLGRRIDNEQDEELVALYDYLATIPAAHFLVDDYDA